MPLIYDEPSEVYHAKRAHYLTSHRLGEFRSNPCLFRKRELNLLPEEHHSAFTVGSATHALILEGRKAYESRFAIGGPINPRTGKPFGSDTQKFEEWAIAQGKPVLSESQAALIETLDLAIRQHPLASVFLGNGFAESVGRCELHGMPCQARFDWIHPDKGLIDLKTCDDLANFVWSAKAYGYIHQMAFYRAVLRAVIGTTIPVHLIAVEKKEPYRCGVWRIADTVVDQAERENIAAMERLRICRRDDNWPTGFEDLQSIDYL